MLRNLLSTAMRSRTGAGARGGYGTTTPGGLGAGSGRGGLQGLALGAVASRFLRRR